MSDLAQTDRPVSAATETTLKVENLKKNFGGLHVFDAISFELAPDSVLGVIGPNGAGKTTLINVICGMLAPSAGRVLLGDQDISSKPLHVISRLGVLRSFQQTNTFRKATVEENLHRAQHFSIGREGPEVDVAPLIEEFDLARHLHEQSDSMAYGKQKMLGLLMALAAEAQIPASGRARRRARAERADADRPLHRLCTKFPRLRDHGGGARHGTGSSPLPAYPCAGVGQAAGAGCSCRSADTSRCHRRLHGIG